MSIVRSWISQVFLAKKYFYFGRTISQELIIASLFIIKVILNPVSATIPCIVRREYFSIIFNVKSAHYNNLNMVTKFY
jgi:hypothetical protein